MKKSATIEGNYRYLLRREWDDNAGQTTFVMLNPSTADASQDDRTLCRCIHFARFWGYGSVEVVNLFAYRATKPRDLFQVTDPVGSKNNSYLQAATERAALVIVAWGIHGSFLNRDRVVLSLISACQSLYCLGQTKAGHPRHPLYIKNSVYPMQLLL
ncbi:DUF1643 domain-containing protein [Tolypothrix bouteillei VB521301_2]|uniref:DUF1643 domain-containing protein n=1 Tax=Tolypothrix bouteillei VB521301 TaxID=1479485 RepID=A0A8S9SXU1_9CYAN|nr:DUF1643 domain-containing protein [Tolypothrix bouteillei]KAF3884083.1 DUF1643 domain-containing protein [Tolypothrix bouteillei VB521301]